MEARKENSTRWRQSSVSALVLLAGVLTDNALSMSVRVPLVGQAVAVICGLAVGALAVLIFREREGAHTSAAALYSALTVIVFTLTLPRVEYLALLALCVATVAACLVSSRHHPVIPRPAPVVPVPVKARENHR